MGDRHGDGNNKHKESPFTMLTKLYALLTDTYALDAPIYVFHELSLAENAMRSKDTGSASIITFNVADALIGGAAGMVYLAISLEDSGIRIHAAFRNLIRLRSYMPEHVGESVCIQAVARLEPVISKERSWGSTIWLIMKGILRKAK